MNLIELHQCIWCNLAVEYSDDSDIRAALLHILGDNKGFIADGIQDTFKKELCGYNIFTGVNAESKSSLNLTLDSELCAYAYQIPLNWSPHTVVKKLWLQGVFPYNHIIAILLVFQKKNSQIIFYNNASNLSLIYICLYFLLLLL